MKKFSTRFLTVLLAVAILVAGLPMSVFAAEVNNSTNASATNTDLGTGIETVKNAEVYAVDEDIALRNSNTKYIRMSDGSYYVAMYNNEVHYQNEDGEWEEIDNTLLTSASEDDDDFVGVSTAKSKYNVKFANNSSSSKLVTIKDGNYKISFGLVNADKTKAATITNPETHDEDATALERLIYVKNAVSSVVYEDILENVDLEYVVNGNDIKENIIIKEKSDSYIYEFDMKLNKLTAELLENGTIALKDEESNETVFVIDLPFMLDANGDYSNAVTYSLEQIKNKEYRITITANSEWINNDNRAFPVTIDPPISVYNSAISADTTVMERYPDTNYGSDGILTSGYASEYSEHIYWKLTTLPVIPSNSIIINATLSLYPINVTTSEAYVGVYKSAISWEEDTLTWNDISSINGDIVDYVRLTSDNINEDEVLVEHYVTWDITKIAKDWYYGTTNNGLALRMIPDGASDGSCYAQFAASETIAYPIFTVQYRNIVGLEDYYTYQTQSIGRAGTGYVNNYTSQLTLVHTDLTSNSETLPFTISHVYNSAFAGKAFTNSYNSIHTASFTRMKLGEGWKLNVQETIMQKSVGSVTYLLYNDSDGTEHYFIYDSDANKWVDEDGLGLTITFESSSTQCTMTDKQGNRKIFVNGVINQIIDTNGNTITIEYNSAYQLQRITRYNAGGTTEVLATFTYDPSSYYLTSITDSIGRSTTFTYDGALLTKITGPDGKSAVYTYNNADVMTCAYDEEANYGIKYSVSSTSAYLTNIITGYHEYYVDSSGYNRIGQQVEIENDYGRNSSYTDYGQDGKLYSLDDIITTYRFDLQGRTIGAYSTDKNHQKIYGANSTGYTSGTGGDANKISSFGVTGVMPYNWIKNGSMETEYSWYRSLNVSYSQATAHTGYYSAKMTTSSTSSEAYMYQTASLGDSEAYTVSAYVDISNLTTITSNGGVYIKVVSDYDGATIVSDKLNMNLVSSLGDKWQRISCTFYPEYGWGGDYTIYIYMDGVIGTVYVDDIQVENFSAPSNYNLIGSLTEWSMSNAYSTIAPYSTEYGVIDAIWMIGEPAHEVFATMTIPINKSATTTFMFSTWASGSSVPQDDFKEFKTVATLNFTDGTSESIDMYFQSNVTTGEQFLTGIITPKTENLSKTINNIVLKLSYAHNANSVYFYNMSLVEEAAQTYKYDDDGNLIAVNQTDSSSISSVYDDLDRLESQGQGNQNFTYTYKTTGNTRLVDTVSSDGVTMKFTYDSAGNVTGTVITNASGSMKISSSTSYTSDKNFVSSVTDSTGATTYYGYNNRGLLTSSLNANNTLVEYDYNAYNDRQSISYISGVVSAAYEYTKGSLAKITRGGYIEGSTTKKNQEYNFTYDGFGNVLTVSVGNYTLVTYTYGNYNGNLLTTTYGNGTVIENVYDVLDRIIQIKYNGVVRYNYSYNGNGDLCRVEDVLNDITYNYEYDSLDRLHSSYMTIGDNIDLISRYTYDDESRVSVYYCSIGGVTGGTGTYTYGYTYDEPEYVGDEVSGLLESMTIDGANINGDTINYAYDTLQRLTTKSTVGQYRTLAQNYAYRTVSGNQTTQISNLSWTVGSTSAVAYSYTYDAVGNILTVSENNTLKASYTYDEQNQLLTETLWDTGIRYEYTYDTYGNIRSVEEYNANTGARISGDTYSYTNSTWLDRLTAFNGITITYDNIGNPLSYNNGSAYTFTWDGRELASVVKGGVTTSYTYGADGLRTQKQYGSTTYNYYYVDGRLVRMTWANSYIDFLYDESGSVYSFVYDGDQYYFVKNLQGDVVKIYSIWGTKLVEYDYDAWGNCTVVYEHSSYGDLAEINPIRYRGYYYDFETGFYYLNSRYYDPQVRRFISADIYVSTGQGMLGFNMYAYCSNNPVLNKDDSGTWYHIAIGAVIGGLFGAVSTCASLMIENKLYEDDPTYTPHSTKSIITQSLISGIIGAASGAIAAIGGSPALLAAMDATLSATESIANNLVSDIYTGAKSTFKDIVVDAAVSVGTSLAFSAISDPTDGKMDELYSNYKSAQNKAMASSNPNAMKNFMSSSSYIRYDQALTKFFNESICDGFVGTMASGTVEGYIGCILPN